MVRYIKMGGDSGQAITDSQANSNLLWQRIANNEMPPGEAKISQDKKEIVRRWIEAGAPTLRPEPESLGPGVPLAEEERAYWAYQAFRHPETSVPLSDSPLCNGIDGIVKSAMPPGLEFSPDASRSNLIRRIYIDLLGLPPTMEQVDCWSRHPDDDWYSQMVEQALQSPAYGERWARHWLDAIY